MDIENAKAFINLVTAECQRRADLLSKYEDENNANFSTDRAYDQWMFTDLPFLHDLCILYLVAVRHHIERRLLFHAARALGHGKEIERSEFEKQQKSLLEMSPGKRWEAIKKRLRPDKCKQYKSVETLRLLANSYKHEPGCQPSVALVKHLDLDEELLSPIPESFELQKGLARKVGLPDDSHYYEITERFVEHADEFLKDVEAKNSLSPVPVSHTKFAQ